MKKINKKSEDAEEEAEEDYEDYDEGQEDADVEADVEDADAEANAADVKEYNKLSKRSVHITKEQINDVKTMLTFMGIPYVEAPCEAEAQCAELTKGSKVFASATEDMDCLTFGSKVLLRHLTDSRTKNVTEIHINKVLDTLNLTYEQFVDFCILCGCDYTNTISGIGPKRSLSLIKEHNTIEEIIKIVKAKKKNTDKNGKSLVPEHLEQNISEVRSLFVNPDVTPHSEINIVFKKIQVPELINFLVTEKNFNKERVERGIARIQKVVHNNSGQTTMHKYFTKS